MYADPEDTTRDDHGENYTLEVCEDLSFQAAKFLHDLLHGRHDKALRDATGRTGDEIECVYMHTDKRDEAPDGEAYVHLLLVVEFLEAPAHMDKPERTEVSAVFGVSVWTYTSHRPDAEMELVEPDEDDQLHTLNIKPGTSSPRELSGIQYDVAQWESDTDDWTHHYFEVWGPDGQEPVAPATLPISYPPVACDIDLPF
jgi:hypothetical protein